jgi:hypothetical protein
MAPLPLYPAKKRRYALNGRLSGPQSWSGRFRGEKKLLPLPRFEPRTVKSVGWLPYQLLYLRDWRVTNTWDWTAGPLHRYVPFGAHKPPAVELALRTRYGDEPTGFYAKAKRFFCSPKRWGRLHLLPSLPSYPAKAQLVEELRYKWKGRGVFEIFHWLNPSGRTVALEMTPSLTEMSTRDLPSR